MKADKPWNYENLWDFVRDRIRNSSYAIRGGRQKLANQARIHPTLLSQIIKGKRELTLEQAERLGKALRLDKLELEGFFILTQLSQTTSPEVKAILFDTLAGIGVRAKEHKYKTSSGSNAVELPELDQALFYSNWYFSAIRLLTSIEPPVTVFALAAKLRLSETIVKSVLRF